MSERDGFCQIIQELEKQRIEVMCNILSRYNLQMSSFGQTLKHVRPYVHLPHKHPFNPLTDIMTNRRCIFTRVLFPGTKTDRTGGPEGGHGQRLTSPGGAKQYPN